MPPQGVGVQFVACAGAVSLVRIALGGTPHTLEVYALRQNVAVSGGPGDDRMHVGARDLQLDADPGNDDVSASAQGGSATAAGGAGNDTLSVGASGLLTVFGGDGDDFLTGGRSGSSLDGGPGNDRIDAGLSTDTRGLQVSGGPGDDTLNVSPARLNLVPRPDAADISCGPGHDTISAAPRVRLSAQRAVRLPLRFAEPVRVRLKLSHTIRPPQVATKRLPRGTGKLTLRLSRSTVAALRRVGCAAMDFTATDK